MPTDYDPLLGKLIAWGADREEAIARLRRALSEYYVNGITTNVGLFRRILEEPEFVRGEIYTRWLDDMLQKRPHADEDPAAETVAALAIALWHSNQSGSTSQASEIIDQRESRWKSEGRSELLRQDPDR